MLVTVVALVALGALVARVVLVARVALVALGRVDYQEGRRHAYRHRDRRGMEAAISKRC